MTRKQRCVIAFTVLTGLGALPAFASSATLSFEAPAERVAPSSEFEVKILVDSTAALNAYSASVRYPAHLLEFTGSNNSRSIINIWQGQPVVFESGILKFAGGSLTPFEGKGGELLALRFRAKNAGTASLVFESVATYLANGKGTKTDTEGKNLTIVIAEGALLLTADLAADRNPPEISFLSFIEDPFNPNQKLVSFIAKDDRTGIQETRLRVKTWFGWKDLGNVKNPAAVGKNAWAAELTATDNAGNSKHLRVYDRKALSTNMLVAIGVIAGIFVIATAVKKRKRK